MLTSAHHFGITVTSRDAAMRFYLRALRLPHMADSISRGEAADEMYRLRGAENHVSWFQIGEQGTELFNLPNHPMPPDPALPRLDAPGWRYAAFDVAGFDDLIERLQEKSEIRSDAAHRFLSKSGEAVGRGLRPPPIRKKHFAELVLGVPVLNVGRVFHGAPGASSAAIDGSSVGRGLRTPPRITEIVGRGLRPPPKSFSLSIHETATLRVARLTDPDGASILLFDSGEPARIGKIVRIREAGLVATSAEGYDDFFSAIGLPQNDPGDDSFLSVLFGYSGEIRTSRFGDIRLITLPGAALESRPRMFPYSGGEHLDAYNAPGIKHIAYRAEDIDEFYTRAATRGVFFLTPPTTIPGGSRMCYFSDPEGHVIEAFQLPPALAKIASTLGALRSAQMDVFSSASRALVPFK